LTTAEFELITGTPISSKTEHIDADDMDGDSDDEPEAEAAEKIPTKCITEEVEITVRMAIEEIPFDGRSDGRSIKKILTNVAPRKIVRLHAPLASRHSSGGTEACHRYRLSFTAQPSAPRAFVVTAATSTCKGKVQYDTTTRTC